MITRILATTLMFVGIGFAQMPTPPMPPGPMPQGPTFHVFTGGHQHIGAPEWWRNPEIAQKIGITDAQLEKLNQLAFDDHMKMIDVRAALEREELKLRHLMDASTLDENQILAQIDKVATQRAQIEKAQVQMMLAVRRVLTPEQLKKFREVSPFGGTRERLDDDRGPGGNRMFFRQEFRRAPGMPNRGPDNAPPEASPQK